MPKHSRVIGTTKEAIARAESELGVELPPTFANWLLKNNGLGLESVTIFPVHDDRDPRKTWDSIVRQNRQFLSYLAECGQLQDWSTELLPFASFGTGDFYCFNYASKPAEVEPTVVLWSHEDGSISERGTSFSDFSARLVAGDFEYD